MPALIAVDREQTDEDYVKKKPKKNQHSDDESVEEESVKLPDEDSLRSMLEDVQYRAQESRQILIRSNLRLVVSVAKRYLGRGARSST